MAKTIGDFPNRATDWVNGEEINGTVMNEIDRGLYLLDQSELHARDYDWSRNRYKYWSRNQKNLYKGETLTAGADCTQSTDTTNIAFGASTSRITVNSTLGDKFIKGYINKSPASNLQYFQAGDTVDVAKDFILWTMYISDATKIKSNSLILLLGTASGHFYKIVTPTTGWKTYAIRLNEFQQSSSPTWSAITYYEFQWYTPTGINAQNTYISFQYMGLIRGQTGSGNYNMTFENNGENVYTADLVENVAFMSHYEDFLSEPCAFALQHGSLDSVYLSRNRWKTFYLKADLVCKRAGSVSGFKWRIDSSNYVVVYIESNTLQMRLYASGSEVLSESNSNVLPYSILLDDVVEFRFKKVGSYIECGVVTNGGVEEFCQLGYSAWTNLEGDVVWGAYGTSIAFTGLYDYMLGNSNTIIENRKTKLRNDYIKLTRTTDQSISGTGDVVIQWNNKELQGGNRLTYDSGNYAIKVGKGVKTVEILGRSWAESIAVNAFSWSNIKKNGIPIAQDIIPYGTNTWRVHQGTTIINVAENDLITMTISFSQNGANSVRGTNSYGGACELSAKVLEYT